jgi:hypothetical protein
MKSFIMLVVVSCVWTSGVSADPVKSNPMLLVEETRQQCINFVAQCQRECERWPRQSQAWLGCRMHCGNAGSCNEND